jgi:hypothetical protein
VGAGVRPRRGGQRGHECDATARVMGLRDVCYKND